MVWKWTAAAFCDVSKMHRNHGNYLEQKTKVDFVICVHVCQQLCYAKYHSFYITPWIHKPHEFNDPLALLILNRTTARYTPDSTVLIEWYFDCLSWILKISTYQSIFNPPAGVYTHCPEPNPDCIHILMWGMQPRLQFRSEHLQKPRLPDFFEYRRCPQIVATIK